MKKIIYLIVSFFIFHEKIFSQDFPDLSLEQFVPACSTFPVDGEKFVKDPFPLSCNPGKWKPFSGSGDIILLNENGIHHSGIAIGTGISYNNGCSTQSSPCPPAQKTECNAFGKNVGEGVMYIGNTFRKGKKYFLKMEYQIILSIKSDNDLDTRLDYAGIKLSNSGVDITSQCGFSDCDDTRPWLNLNNFTSISGQEIWNGSGTMMPSRQKIEFCFTPKEDFNQMLFFTFDANSPNPNFEPKAFFFKIYDLEVSCCENSRDYLGTENTPYYPPNNSPIAHLPLPSFTEVKDKIRVIPTTGDVVVKSTEKVLLRANNSVELKAGVNQKVFSVEKGATFQIEIKPCSGCASNEECAANYTPYNPQGDPFQYVYIPNTFDPSGGHGSFNSRFFPQTSSLYQMPYNASYGKLEIFNRWGDRVFSSETKCGQPGIDPLSLSWNGCFNGVGIAPDVFTYQLILENCNNRGVKSGSVTLYASNSNCNQNLVSDENSSTAFLVAPTSKKTFNGLNNKINNDYNIFGNTNYAKDTEIDYLSNIFSVYPNPTKDILLVIIPKDNQDNYDIYIRDIVGRIVKTIKHTQATKESTSLKIDIHDIPSGSYIIHAQSLNSRTQLSQKFVKN